MNFRKLILELLVICFCINLPAAFYVDGKKNSEGIYIYHDMPTEGGSFKGDLGKKLLSFGEGALTDGKFTENFSVGFPHQKDQMWCSRIYFDLGAIADIDLIVMRSRIFAGTYKSQWRLHYGEIAVSTDGKIFNIVKKDDAKEKKFNKWNEFRVEYKAAQKTEARYIRIDVQMPRWNNGQLTEVDIYAFKLYSEQSVDVKKLENIITTQNSGHLVDRYGQFSREDWVGKITSDEELKNAYLNELKKIPDYKIDYQKNDRFGGDKTLGIKSQTSDKFRVEKIDGKWWFITPDGWPFVMIAIDAMNLSQAVTTVKHPRIPEIAQRFLWTPEPNDQTFSSCWRKEGDVTRFDFAKANFIRIHGNVDNLNDIFVRDAYKRIRDWGFNSLGKWTNENTILTLQRLKLDIPFLLVLNISTEAPIAKYNKVPDMFDPSFENAVDKVVAETTKKFGRYPYYMGFTIANEHWWNNLGTQALLKANATHAKKVLVQMIIDNYKDINGVNKALNSDFSSVADLAEKDLNNYSKILTPIISDFIVSASQKYYSIWQNARDKHDAKRLILGSSFVIVGMWHVCDEWIRGSVPYSDVMMCDNHSIAPETLYNDYIAKYVIPADKPVMNGESSFCTTGFGFKYFKTNCTSQAGRGEAYKFYNEKLYSYPEWLGTMYFVYRDQPIGGRNINGGGESYNNGLVNNCHLAYEDFIKGVKEVNSRLFKIHAQK